MADAAQFQARLDELRKQFVRRLSDYDEAIATAWKAVLGATTEGARTDGLTALKFSAHKLSGSGSTFGFPAITETAFALERHLSEQGAGELGETGSLVQALRKAVADARGG